MELSHVVEVVDFVGGDCVVILLDDLGWLRSIVDRNILHLVECTKLNPADDWITAYILPGSLT